MPCILQTAKRGTNENITRAYEVSQRTIARLMEEVRPRRAEGVPSPRWGRALAALKACPRCAGGVPSPRWSAVCVRQACAGLQREKMQVDEKKMRTQLKAMATEVAQVGDSTRRVVSARRQARPYLDRRDVRVVGQKLEAAAAVARAETYAAAAVEESAANAARTAASAAADLAEAQVRSRIHTIFV